MTISFKQLAYKILKETERPMSPSEIWNYTKQRNFQDLVQSKGKTPERTIGAQIYVDIKNNAESPFLKIEEAKPRKFFLKELANELELQKIRESEVEDIEQPAQTTFNERDLHPFLTYFADTFMNVHTKTIYHERSKKSNYAQWLHPDIVGVNLPIGEWNSEVLEFGMKFGSQLVKIYSFELKKELTFSNLRESFFQTVSNSSWANEGYLVASKVSKDDEFLNELKRLSTAFGIGIVELDIEDPDSSSVLFPARYKQNLDWETMNKITVQNPDFKKFIKRVKNDLNSHEVIKQMYDKVYEVEQLVEMINK
ncbi:HTH domain-containing protein [Alkalihalophilus lindianensis]|uniref:HTH domain-containing protein n=1 Tax=Alkalihalophilus lindianensis TaxID=1630542 RepID=A0ABU3XF05_9BACI|nr:HTH domain-containing protein [Alkalihalophilus lindianensis]MDV2686482.1 HTH domain-containing protein [Alkalihalophilus lindianensis]